MEVNLGELVNIANLTDWLDVHVPELGTGPLQCELLHGGTSNVVFTLDRGGPKMVLRRPPAVAPPGAEKGVLREARVLTALNQTDVPHPICFGSCDDISVTGAPFYVMEKVDGWAPNLRDEKILNQAPFDRMPYEFGLPFAMVDGLIRLANVDYRAVGLEGFGKPGKFLERQVDRWAGQLNSYAELYKGYEPRKLEGYEVIEEWLRARTPGEEHSGIIHGDVGTPNMIFHWGPPARLAAMIDWELSTIGDPMIDLGWLTGGLRDERFPDLTPVDGLYKAENFPTKQELARYYCAGTGRDIADFDFFSILAGFKAGCVLEYKVAQAAAGILPRKTGEFFAAQVDRCFSRNAEIVRRIS